MRPSRPLPRLNFNRPAPGVRTVLATWSLIAAAAAAQAPPGFEEALAAASLPEAVVVNIRPVPDASLPGWTSRSYTVASATGWVKVEEYEDVPGMGRVPRLVEVDTADTYEQFDVGRSRGLRTRSRLRPDGVGMASLEPMGTPLAFVRAARQKIARSEPPQARREADAWVYRFDRSPYVFELTFEAANGTLTSGRMLDAESNPILVYEYLDWGPVEPGAGDAGSRHPRRMKFETRRKELSRTQEAILDVRPAEPSSAPSRIAFTANTLIDDKIAGVLVTGAGVRRESVSEEPPREGAWRWERPLVVCGGVASLAVAGLVYRRRHARA